MPGRMNGAIRSEKFGCLGQARIASGEYNSALHLTNAVALSIGAGGLPDNPGVGAIFFEFTMSKSSQGSNIGLFTYNFKDIFQYLCLFTYTADFEGLFI